MLSILISLKDNEKSECIKTQILEDISAGLGLTVSILFDCINEMAISQTGTLLLEEEDEENFYIDILVLNSILSGLTA